MNRVEVKESNVSNGQYVNEGDILYVFDIETLSDTIVRYQDELESAKDRIEILSAYEKSLDGDIKVLEICADNPYYDEFVNKRELLYANVILNKQGDSTSNTLFLSTFLINPS